MAKEASVRIPPVDGDTDESPRSVSTIDAGVESRGRELRNLGRSKSKSAETSTTAPSADCDRIDEILMLADASATAALAAVFPECGFLKEEVDLIDKGGMGPGDRTDSDETIVFLPDDPIVPGRFERSYGPAMPNDRFEDNECEEGPLGSPLGESPATTCRQPADCRVTQRFYQNLPCCLKQYKRGRCNCGTSNPAVLNDPVTGEKINECVADSFSLVEPFSP
eukprot:CAMPEP_0194048080 /NCGR_PEP_ID=MMETSP0009_2-20130614/26714_1 /TAXON_ID=210454 /ORGANISM="Grammatophora oceanica, Strain CCMP 410" /LENGTH=222 /DNA_ID=CAMNT_0038693885 /DNA_START=110 /DNA_END=778 /DNA_ORIENTATION=+